MGASKREIAGLDVHVVDSGEAPKLAVILCHGFGAPGTDLVPLADEFLQSSATLRDGVRFYFPQALLRLDSYGLFGGRAWWMIDMEAIQRAAMAGGFVARDFNQKPEGLTEARESLLALIRQVKQETGLDENRLVLGGFSQGSMLTIDVAAQLESKPAGLIAWSGTLLNALEWEQLGRRHAGLQVVQSHGTQDPILSFQAAEALRDFMLELGWQVRWLPFMGPHTISPDGLRAALELLEGAMDG
jgi:phospholipase/carboxylesterase